MVYRRKAIGLMLRLIFKKEKRGNTAFGKRKRMSQVIGILQNGFLCI